MTKAKLEAIELERQLRSSQEQVAQLKGKVEDQQALIDRLRAILFTLASKCPDCMGNVTPLSWNSSVMAVTCLNVKCIRFRQPLRTANLEEIQSLLKSGPLEEVK